VLAAGNAAGDIDMLRAARFALVIHHDDAVREYAYDDYQILDAAAEGGWTVLSMRDEFAPHLASGPRRWRAVTDGSLAWSSDPFQHADMVSASRHF